LRGMVRSWGFKLITIFAAILLTSGGLNYFIIKMLLSRLTGVK
jgi:hypothetical protein